MNKLMLTLLLLPLSAFADLQPDAVEEFTRTSSAIAAPDWVRIVSKKTGTGTDDIGMLIPARLCFAPSGTLSEKGRSLLGQAEAFAKQTNKKLYLQIPSESTELGLLEIARTSPSGYLRRSTSVGNHIHLSIKD